VKRALLVLGCLLVGAAADAAPGVRSSPVAAESPAPSDVQVEMIKAESGQWTVKVRRAGHLVALRAGDRTSVGPNWVAAEIDGPSGSRIELGWETTDAATLETSRGGIRVEAAGDGPRVSWFSLPAPTVAAEHRHRLHECRAFEAESGGFSVVCRVQRGARKLSALNLTDEAPLSAVAMADLGAQMVRLDLPVAEGSAEARLVGYLDGNTAVVMRAEATWVRGEARPTLSLADGTRRQLAAPTLRRFPRKWWDLVPDAAFRF
jgi:hypothetical protein